VLRRTSPLIDLTVSNDDIESPTEPATATAGPSRRTYVRADPHWKPDFSDPLVDTDYNPFHKPDAL
jgi:hypothetical protein